MAYSWNDPDARDLWTLTIDESALLSGMTDKGRLGFAAQLKFMQLQGRFPERHDEIDPSAAQWLAAQLGTTAEALSSYELCGRQGQRHRRTIRDFLGFRRATGADLQQLVQWLCDDVFPFDPQARHGHDMALDWCRTQRLEPPVGDYLDRVIRSAMHGYETQYQQALSQFQKRSFPPGQLLTWVCRDNVGYLDITTDRLEMTPTSPRGGSVPASDDTYRVSQRRALAELLDSKVNELMRAGVADDFMLLSHMAPDMPLFKRLMDLSDGDGMNDLCAVYPGLYRFAKLLELIAAGIQSGDIEVPR